MAKIKFGMMMTDARGKLGGQVFSKNRAGSYVRTKVTPVNPQTAAQMASRQLLGSLSTGWNGLSASAIAAWNAAVNDWKSTDIFGDIKVPTGKNLYTALNKNSLGAGGSAISLPPEKMAIDTISEVLPLFDISDQELSLDITTVPANHILQVWATPAVNEGVSYVKNKLRVISNVPAGGVNPATLWQNYVDKFGTPVLGQKIYVGVRYIGTNGQAGVRLIEVATIQP